MNLHARVRPETLFIVGLALVPAFLLPPWVAPRLALALLFLALAIGSGRRFRPLTTFGMAATIIGFNLLAPYGRVLAAPFGLPITSGALLSGIDKAVSLQGLIWLSQATIHPGLRLPGSFGRLLAGTFLQLDRLKAHRGLFDPRKPFASLDALLLALEADGPAPGSGRPRVERSTAGGVIALAILGALCAAPWIVYTLAAPPGWLNLSLFP